MCSLGWIWDVLTGKRPEDRKEDEYLDLTKVEEEQKLIKKRLRQNKRMRETIKRKGRK